MFKKSIYTILLLFLLIENVLSQGAPAFPKHPQDERFYDMEKRGKKPKDVPVKFGPKDVPNITVDIVKIKDQESNAEYISNKSKLSIKWNIENDSNANNLQVNNNALAQINNNQISQNNNLQQNNTAPTQGNLLQQNGFTYTLKLLSNVTQDYTSGYFYSYAEQIIQSNINANEYEYKIPKLDENCVYNIVVVSEQPNAQQMNDIGISKTYRYRYIAKDSSNDNGSNENGGKSGINPVVFIIIGGVAIALIAIAFLASRGFGKKGRDEDEDEYNLPVQSPTSPNGSFDNRIDSDHVSVITDDTGEVSWSNLEIAQTSQQTKNEANDKVIRTLDRKFKREDKSRNNNIYVNGEKQIYKVVRMFEPTESDEIKLNIGDEVEITVIFEDGWCEGNNLSTNKGGVFPRTCVVEIEQYASLIKKSKNSLVPTRRRSKHNSYSNKQKPQNYQYKSNNLINIPE